MEGAASIKYWWYSKNSYRKENLQRRFDARSAGNSADLAERANVGAILYSTSDGRDTYVILLTAISSHRRDRWFTVTRYCP